MNILVAGGAGQLGRAIRECLTGHEVISVDLPEVDICDGPSVQNLIERVRPNVLINCAAYTNVDGCVVDYETAYRINAVGPMKLAQACRSVGIPMMQMSTNEVFDGTREEGYEEWMPISPINRYGMSKAAGEFNVRSILQEHYIVRTAWLFAAGGRNFPHAILKRAREAGRLRVVTDEIGNPTYAWDLAKAIAQLIDTGQYGTYHFVNYGACSRWEFANEILQAAGMEGVENEPILSSEFVRASTPPAFGALRNMNGAAIGIELRPWQEAVAEFVRAEDR
jgi:dTDP-4-dehydrorhamnose reductase